jgi:hypothetical protein
MFLPTSSMNFWLRLNLLYQLSIGTDANIRVVERDNQPLLPPLRHDVAGKISHLLLCTEVIHGSPY